MLGRGTVFTIFFVVTIAIFLFLSQGYPEKARLFPQIVLIPTLILCMLQLILDLSPKARRWYEGHIESDLFKEAKKRSKKGSSSKKEESRINPKRELTGFSWLISLMVLIYLLGFKIAIPIFALIFFWVHSINWVKTLIITAAVWFFVYLLFDWYLRIPFSKGLLFDIFS